MVTPVNIVVEDPLSETIARVILDNSGHHVGHVYGLQGNLYIKKKIKGFNNASRFTPYFILTDLDNHECAPELIEKWFVQCRRNTNCIFRVAICEVEAWLLADRERIAKFLGIALRSIPDNPDNIDHPKEALISLARRSRYRQIREDIIPSSDLVKVGPDYNGRLSYFVQTGWRLSVAQRSSGSLNKAVEALKNFRPCIVGD